MLRSLLGNRAVRALIFNPLSRCLLLYPLFWAGYLFFRCTGRTPWFFYVIYLLLHEQTRGQLGRRLADTIGRRRPHLDFSTAAGVLGSGAALEAELEEAVKALREDGYHVFRARLPGDLCRALTAFATSEPALLRPPQPGLPRQLAFDAHEPKAPTYHFEEGQLVRNAAVQQLLADPTLMCLAQRYLGTVPISDLVALWWSAPWGRASSEAAQLFHFDIDRIRFLKIFFYLTDVGPANGPHVFVRGSHGPRPEPFYQARRFTDAEVASRYAPGQVAEITGAAGTIIAVDTSGLHKGKPLESGCRLLFQMEFASSLFGEKYQRLAIPANAAPELIRSLEHYPAVFERFSRVPQPRPGPALRMEKTV